MVSYLAILLHPRKLPYLHGYSYLYSIVLALNMTQIVLAKISKVSNYNTIDRVT